MHGDQKNISATHLLYWCAGGAVLVQLLLWRWQDSPRFTPIFRLLLGVLDTHGNLLLAALVLCAWLLRGSAGALVAVRFAAQRPWAVALGMFPLLCLGALRVYHDHPLSMDEYAAVFQAKIFAAGRLSGGLPPELLDRLIPPYHQGTFLAVSRATGEVASGYWPGYALLLAPFAWLGIPWAANPAIGALTIPVLHRLALQISGFHAGSREAAGWTVLLTAASPVFVVTAISYYSMAAHLLLNALYAVLLLQPSAGRALLAGLIGSLALTLHQPAPHVLFCAPFILWLLLRGGSLPILAALLAGYVPLALLLGVGWQGHLSALASSAAPGAAAAAATIDAGTAGSVLSRIFANLSMPGLTTVEARLAGLAKAWTWAAPGLLILAIQGYLVARPSVPVRLVGAALAVTFFGYFLFGLDQGHGWGNRYLHSAWFALPLLASLALVEGPQDAQADALRRMVAWAALLSLVLVNGLRLVQTENFIGKHLRQIPPLARAPAPQRPELVFVAVHSGVYTRDMVHNDPFLRGPRISLVYRGADEAAALAARRFPGYEKSAGDYWGELWIRRP
jgi:hypothetical protein